MSEAVKGMIGREEEKRRSPERVYIVTTRLCDGLGARLGNFQGWAGKLRNTIVGTQITKRGPYQLVPDNHFNCAHTFHRPSTQKTHCIAEVFSRPFSVNKASQI